jgi:glucose/arabinose dehydrogenase
MKRRTFTALAATLACGAVPAAAQAASGPPVPTAAGGKTVNVAAIGVKTPTSFAYGAGTLFEGDGGYEASKIPDGGVNVLQNGQATAVPSSYKFVSGMAWHNGALYVAGGGLAGKGIAWTLQKWTGWNGTAFAKQTVIYTAPKKFASFNGIAFGPNGRLYVGVDVGLIPSNDHGPATTSPYVYDILTFNANGKNLKVYASGIRQPWQMVFAPGSRNPLVSDLNQDAGKAGNGPDFILKVKPNDNYGFPGCNHTPAANKCTGFAKPFVKFAPHSDIMGLAIIRKTLYMTSFLGVGKGAGKAGEVLSMPLSGGKPKPFLTHFLAPTVGLGTNGSSLFVGQLGDPKKGPGIVYSVTP